VEVPFLDVGASYSELGPALDEAYRRVMKRGRFVLDNEVESFETEFAHAVGATGVRGVASGLDALALALRALGVEPGDEVIVPSFTFIATWLSVSAIGALPVPAEPDGRTAGLTPEAARRALTSRTRAIVPVHLFGLPVDIVGFSELSAESGTLLVFDAAQAHGARWQGSAVGAFGDACAWSFYPSKNLGAFGDAGAVSFIDPSVAERLESLRNYGSSEKYVHDERGSNSRLDELQAAFLRVKLPRLADWNERRSAIAARYVKQLEPLPITLPPVPEGRCSSWHLFVLQTERRDELQDHLTAAGVRTVVHYPIPPHRQLAYSDLHFGPLPIADRLARDVLSLPIGPHLTDEQVDYVVAAVESFPW
jgi:dTDP-3-amino-3,4,6-trideoxy-alpha-D-glucose transaminase